MDKPTSIPTAPRAEQRPYSFERHGVTIEDPYHWLRDPKYPEVDDPDVLAYLKAENVYFEGWKAQHQGLLDQTLSRQNQRAFARSYRSAHRGPCSPVSRAARKG